MYIKWLALLGYKIRAKRIAALERHIAAAEDRLDASESVAARTITQNYLDSTSAILERLKIEQGIMEIRYGLARK